MRSFASDNNSGVHPLVMEALNRANIDHSLGYGDDKWTEEAVAKIKETFTPNCVPLFVFNGTGSNVVALQLMTRPYHSIFCAETAHIYVDECGSPVKMTGCQIRPIATPDGKLTPELIILSAWFRRSAPFTTQSPLHLPMYRTWHHLYSRRIETSDRLCPSEWYVCTHGRSQNSQRLCRFESFLKRTDSRLRSRYS